MESSGKTLIVVVGPTAVGKTRVAVALARRFQTVVVSADSRQIFRELNIGTAKPDEAEQQGIPHYFINSHSIHDDFNAARYADEALALLEKLFQQHNAVILCGGSGLYVKALLEGFDDIPEIPDEVRERITADYQAHGLAWLQQQVKLHDPHYFQQLDQQNPARLLRALEVKLATGMSLQEFHTRPKRMLPFQVVRVGLELPREELYARIDARMDQMLAAGLMEEATSLFPLRQRNALQTVGYQEIFGFLEGQYDKDEAIRLLKRNSRRYAKRQLTWFKRDPHTTWFNPNELDAIVTFILERSGAQ